jgi:hypothetical protein
MTNAKKTGDPLGITSFGEALKANAETVKIGVETVVKYIDHICEPTAKQLGLMLGDQFGYWRQSRLVALNEKLKNKLAQRQEPLGDLHAPPRIIIKVFEEGSVVDDDEIQDMWAGLLASSCSKDGKDDSNLIFINILNLMTAPEARIINHACRKCIRGFGGMSRMSVGVENKKLQEIARLFDASLLQCELDHLSSLGLIIFKHRQDPQEQDVFEITPQDAALHLYTRCQGYSGSPLEFAEAQSKQPL